MRVVLVVCALVALAAGQNLKPLLDLCVTPPPTPPKTLSDKMALPESYKISGSITNWMSSATSLLVESASKEFRVLQRQSRDNKPERWIQNLAGDKTTMFINVTDGSCNANISKPQLFNIPRFSSIVGNDTSSLYSIVQGLIEFDKTHSGFMIENRVDVVGGVNTATWVSCVSGSNANESKVLLEVRFASDETIQPAQSPFSNPLLLSVRLAELPNFNTTVPLNHISLELDRYELPSGNEAVLEHGIYCKNRNTSDLVLKDLDEFAGTLNYFDYATNRSEELEVFYSKSQQVFIVAGDSFQNGVRILNKSSSKYRNGTDYILHDFKYGYEFTMSQEACESFTTLTDSTSDVVVQKNNSLTMVPLNRLLVDMDLGWNEYNMDTDMSGNTFKTYRAYDSITGTILEAHLTKDGELHSLNTFREGTRALTVSLTINRSPISSSRLNEKSAQLSNCYDDGKFANNTWIVQIKDKHLLDVSKVGLNRLNEAVVESISKNVHPIIPYRVLVFYVESRDGGVSIILRLAEKTTVPPGTSAYNMTSDELTTLDLFNKMNSTMYLEKMPIVVEKVDGVREEWMADAKTMKMYPPESDSGFIGYTGGAMFVLAIFCLLIGVSIGAVGVFVATRRQRISTLAYQVFE